mgnify:CR=1 FL=1
MSATPLRQLAELDGVGDRVYSLARTLYPICRSITGDGVRRTLATIGEHIPLEVHEVPSGTAVFDWTVPKEWNIREAWIRGPDGSKIVDFADCNLHVLNYSTPVRERVDLESYVTEATGLPTLRDIMAELAPIVGHLAASEAENGVQATPPEAATSEHDTLLNNIGHDPVSVDELLQRSGLTIAELSSMLLILELEGKIEKLAGGQYARLSNA